MLIKLSLFGKIVAEKKLQHLFMLLIRWVGFWTSVFRDPRGWYLASPCNRYVITPI